MCKSLMIACVAVFCSCALTWPGSALAQDDPMAVDAPPPMAADPIPVAAPEPVPDDAEPMPAVAEPMPATAEPMPATAEPMPDDDGKPEPYYSVTPAGPEKKISKVRVLNRAGGRVEVNRGPYKGVEPGVNDYVPTHKDLAVRQVTWVGFQMKGAGGRVFVQTDQPKQCNVTPNATRTVLTIECDNTKLRTRNDSRRLDTSFFPSAVTEVDAQQGRDNITRVTITLREPVGYERTEQGNYQFFDFQKPSGFNGGINSPNPSPAGS